MSVAQLGSEPTRKFVPLGSLIYNSVGSVAASLGLVIDYYVFEDLSGSGVFTLNGVPWPDGGFGYIGPVDVQALGFYTGTTTGLNKLLVKPVFSTTPAGTLTDEYWIDVVSSGVANQAPTLSGPATLSMFRNASFTFSDLFASGTFSAQDADGFIGTYRFTDTQPGAGSLWFSGLKMWSSSMEVQQNMLNTVTYRSTGTLGTNDITIEAIDLEGKSSTPLKLTVNVVNQLPVISGPSTTITVNTFDTISFASLVSASDPDGFVIDYFITNDSGTDYFTFLGKTQPKPSFEFMYNPPELLYHAGSTAGSDTFTVKAMDNDYGYSQDLTVTVNVANRPPVVTGPTSISKSAGQIFDLGSLIGGSDPDGTVLGYRFADTTPGEAYLTNDGVKITPHPTEGAWFVVWAADLSKVGYYTGTSTGSNTIEINAIDNLFLSSDTLSMTINTEPNTAPTISGPAKVSTGINQSFGFNSGAAMITGTDVDGAIAQYRFTDSMAGAGNLTLNGVAAPSVFTVPAAELAQVRYSTGSLVGSNVIAIEAIDNAGAPSPAVLLMTINVDAGSEVPTGTNGAANQAPTISGPGTVTKGVNEYFTFGTAVAPGVVVLTATDGDGTVAQYRFSDNTPGAGWLTRGGDRIEGTSVTVTAANLGEIGYETGDVAGSNSIVIEAIDNLGLSSPTLLAMTISVNGTVGAGNQVPTISGPATISKGINESFTFGTAAGTGVVVLSADDSDGTVAQYRFTDSSPGAGNLTRGGNPIEGTSVTVTAAELELGQIGYQTGPSAGTNSIVIEAIDNLGLSSPSFLTTTINVAGTSASANQAPTITGPAVVSKSVNEYFTFSATDGDGAVLLSASDADGTVAQYRFSDSMAGAGYLTYLTLNGAAAPSVFTVPAADLSQVIYYTGPAAGSNSIAIEAIDNLGRASPTVLTMLVNVAGTVSTGGTGGTGGTAQNQAPVILGPSSVDWSTNQSFASVFTPMIIAADPDGTVAQYRFSDSYAGAGHLTLSGQAAPGIFTVAAADLWQVGYSTGQAAGSNVIAIEAIDNLGLASSSVMTLNINIADAGGTGGTGGIGAGTGNQAPTIVGPSSVAQGTEQSFDFTSLLSASDPDGTVSEYRFSDYMSGAGYLTFNGAQIAGTSVTVSAAGLDQVAYYTGTSAGSNSIAIEAIDNLGKASPNPLLMTISVNAPSQTPTDLPLIGSDIAFYPGRASGYTVSAMAGGYTVTTTGGAIAASTVQNLQRVLFDDTAPYGGGSTASASDAGRMLDGGTGIDTLAIYGSMSQYTVSHTPTGFTLYSAAQGSRWVTNVERLMFTDGMVALDIQGDAGMAYRLYQAAFNRAPDAAGLGYQMTALDNGLNLVQVASNFIASPEFQSKYGSLSNEQFVHLLYANVLHREAEPEGYAFHLNHLNNGFTRAEVLVGFSESPENKAALIGVVQDGMHYTL